jgi:3-methyladenine DNA glycosylase AlkD
MDRSMAAKKRPKARPAPPEKPAVHDVEQVVAALRRSANKATRDGLARYAIPSERAFGVPVGEIRKLGKRLGQSHALAVALWKTGHYEARLLATFVDDPAQVTSQQMDRWCKDFDNWAICDTACFALFDRTPHALEKVAAWAKSPDELVKRAAFALLASVASHDKIASDAELLRCWPLLERAAVDPRNFVKKGVSWALRSLGERNAALHEAAVELAERLASSGDATARWIGKGALREMKGAAAQRRLARKQAASPKRAKVKRG